MTNNQTKTEEEKVKEANRKYAIEMNKDENLKNLAGAYLLEQGDFGKDVRNATKNALVATSLQDGLKYVDANSLLKEGEEGESYMENSVKVKDILKGAANNYQVNTLYMKVNDLLEDMGANKDEKFGNKYMQDLMEQDKEVAQNILGIYSSHFRYHSASKATGAYRDNIVKNINENGLEKLTKSDKKKGKKE